MSSTVSLNVTAGPIKGKQFLFEQHDTFIFGRGKECHCRLPGDPKVSRRHFIIEVNPPDLLIRDFGSLNGTYVNGTIIGNRERSETPQEGQSRSYQEIALKNGSVVQVGQSELSVFVDTVVAEGPVLCARCGLDVSEETGGSREGAYICQACRHSYHADPAEVLFDMLAKADDGKGRARGKSDERPTVAGCRVGRRLGNGRFGAVYKAQRESDRRFFALKVMLSRVAVDERSRSKFTQDVKPLEELRHRNIVSLFDSGSAGGAFYFLTELCSCGSLSDEMSMQGGKLLADIALPMLRQALGGLAFAHAQGVVHRDLKPENILIAGTPERPVAKIADLGLVRYFDRAGFSGMTVTGAHSDMPFYTAKEQLTNFTYVRPVSDVWGFGATMYHILSGQTPRDFPSGCDPMEVVLQDEIVPVRERDPEIPAPLAAVIDRAVQSNPKDRYQDAQDMLIALNKVAL